MTYQLRIEGKPCSVDPEKLPATEIGRPGSVLQIALSHGIRINHTCQGVPSCTTCHIYVLQGRESCSPISDQEKNLLQKIYGVREESRLACQCVPNGSRDVVVEIP